MLKHITLVAMLGLLILAAPAAAQEDRWEPHIQKFLALDAANPPQPGGIVFIGSSSIVRWDTERWFPGMGVVNRGFGGSQISDSVRHLDRILLPHRPRTVVFYAGDNDMSSKTPQVIFEDFKAFVGKIHAALPKTRIIYIAVKPSIRRWHLVEPIRQTNALIRAECLRDARLEFLDIFTPGLDAAGEPRPELLVKDLLHLSDAGYALWSSLLRPLLSENATAEGREELWITNAQGDDVHVYELGTWKLLRRIEVGANPHGISATADGRTVHIALESFGSANGELIWIDTASGSITGRLAVGPRPNEIETTPDGRWIVVPCADEQFWIIDGHAKSVAAKIRTGGRPHNTLLAPDGRTMLLLPMSAAEKREGKTIRTGPQTVTLIDTAANHKIVGRIQFANHPRPGALSPDGRLMFQQIDGMIGFQVADLGSRVVTHTIEHPLDDAARAKPSRSHGLAISPDGLEVWSADVEHHALHIHAAAEPFDHLATLNVAGRPYWISFSPDGRYAFVSLRDLAQVAVFDVRTRSLLSSLAAGQTPKRTQVIRVPLK